MFPHFSKMPQIFEELKRKIFKLLRSLIWPLSENITITPSPYEISLLINTKVFALQVGKLLYVTTFTATIVKIQHIYSKDITTLEQSNNATCSYATIAKIPSHFNE